MAKKNGNAAAAPKREPPAHDIRLGRLHASVWRNEHATEGVWFSVTLSRSYKDAQGQWHSASSFGRDDLLAVGELTRLAFHWIAEHQKSQQRERQPGEEGDAPLPE
jgi:hypothetical protein